MVVRNPTYIPLKPTDHNIDGTTRLSSPRHSGSEDIRQFIQDVTFDEKDLNEFYNISFSRTRVQKLGEYFTQRQNEV